MLFYKIIFDINQLFSSLFILYFESEPVRFANVQVTVEVKYQ